MIGKSMAEESSKQEQGSPEQDRSRRFSLRQGREAQSKERPGSARRGTVAQDKDGRTKRGSAA